MLRRRHRRGVGRPRACPRAAATRRRGRTAAAAAAARVEEVVGVFGSVGCPEKMKRCAVAVFFGVCWCWCCASKVEAAIPGVLRTWWTRTIAP